MEKTKKVFLIAAITLVIDQILKLVVKCNILMSSTVTIIPHFFSLTYVENEGAAWSILEGKSVFLVIISFLFLLFIFRCLKTDKRKTKINVLAYGLMIGGIIGNMLDRIFYQKVIDFLSFKVFHYYFPIFNCADMAIVIGMFLFIIDVILEGNEKTIMDEQYEKIREISNGKNSSRRRKH